MKRTTTIVATALSLALTTGALAGCGGQQAASTSEPEATTQATTTETEAAPQTQEELLAEFKSKMAAVPTCTSVTIAEEMTALGKDSDDAITSKTTYKFDESGDQVRTSIDVAIDDLKLTYYTAGDDVVLVTDEATYGGTAEQFELPHAKGVDSYLNDVIGAKGALADMVASVEKMESHGLTFYTVTLDVDKYIASDEALTMLAQSGMPVKEAKLTIGFEADGSFASIDKTVDYEQTKSTWALVFSDYNTTTIEQMPEATNTFEEMEADMQAKLSEVLADTEAAQVEGVTAAADEVGIEEIAEGGEGEGEGIEEVE